MLAPARGYGGVRRCQFENDYGADHSCRAWSHRCVSEQSRLVHHLGQAAVRSNSARRTRSSAAGDRDRSPPCLARRASCHWRSKNGAVSRPFLRHGRPRGCQRSAPRGSHHHDLADPAADIRPTKLTQYAREAAPKCVLERLRRAPARSCPGSAEQVRRLRQGVNGFHPADEHWHSRDCRDAPMMAAFVSRGIQPGPDMI